MDFSQRIMELARVDIFKEASIQECFMGRPFYLDYDKAYLLINDSWKQKVGGVPQGTFLLAFYENESSVSEALLLRALRPTKLPTDNNVISSMIEYYKDNQRTSGADSKLDDFTRYEFSFSGLECSILGTFYKNEDNAVLFGADVENYYSSHNYAVYKAKGKVLEYLVNLKEGNAVAGGETDIPIGKVRYSSSIRFQAGTEDVPAYISPNDFLGKRTALFGMTRTGKSNTVKKVIEATQRISSMSSNKVKDAVPPSPEQNLSPFGLSGKPKYNIGQIIFDVNGEYANANMQDKGTAIFELFRDIVTRYSVVEKPGFKVMKINFYKEINAGFELIQSGLQDETGDYVNSFLAIDWTEPDPNDRSATTRYNRKKAAYLCCLKRAGFTVPANLPKITFQGNKELNEKVQKDGNIDPTKGISIDDAINWFLAIWDIYDTDEFFHKYKRDKGHEWADEDLKALMVVLSRKTASGRNSTINGYLKLRKLIDLHTHTSDAAFQKEITQKLRDGEIVIIDLSQGNPEIQRLYSEKICQELFSNSMHNFIENRPNNFIQFYFEEAHNLFPKKNDSDLSQIYNRLAKEGAKLNLGLIYATQEVSSISSNILKNTQNWFIAHLNNEDEIKELRKYYDFADFSDSLVRFSSGTDKGFVRMKTYSNPFVVPVQIDRFLADKV